jgi:hypothetical protein
VAGVTSTETANEREVKGTPEESEKASSRVLIMIYESFHRQLEALIQAGDGQT